MGNTLRNLLIGATIGLSMPSAMAQSESFTGLSGNYYYVDYETGLVMQLNGDQATIVSPANVVATEFDPIWENILSIASDLDFTNELLQINKDTFLTWTEVWQLQSETFVISTSNFSQMATNLAEHYLNLFNIIDQIFQLRGTAKPPMVKVPENRIATDFTFNIAGTIANYKYAEFMAGFTREYLEDFEAEVTEFGEKLMEGREELDEIMLDYDTVIDYHYAYIEGLYGWLEEYAEIADDDLLYEIALDIQERIGDLKYELEHLPSNPVEYLSTWAEICLDYMQSTEENLAEAVDELMKVTEEISLLRRDFAGMLFAGPLGDEAGLYYTILNGNGSLILPQFAFSDDKQYFVTGVDGNIFSGMPEGVTISDLRLVLPGTISSISNEAFAIDGITEVTVYSNSVPALTGDCFTETTYANAPLYVRDELIDSYKASGTWSKFIHIVPESMAAVGAITDTAPSVALDGATLKVTAPEGANVGVYTTDGKTIYNGNAGNIELPAKGLYIVRAGNRSVKIRY